MVQVDSTFLEKITLLMKLGESHSISDEDEVKIHGLDAMLVEQLGLHWNAGWEKYFPSDDQKITLMKALVLLEKIDDTYELIHEDILRRTRGSVSLIIHVFHYIQFLKLDSPELVDFILQNKSSNPYTPFGGMKYGHLKSHKEYLEFEISEAERQEKVAEQREILKKIHKQNREKKKLEKMQRHKKRIEGTKKASEQKYHVMKSYFDNTDSDFLQDILNQKLPFPLFLSPSKQIRKLEPKILKLNIDQLSKLVNIFPRKSPEHLKEFRKKIIQLKALKLSDSK